ncbi:CoA transferase [Cupriavidus basilensis]
MPPWRAAMAGLRHLTGEPGRAPVRAGLSLGDTIAGLHGAMGVLLALYQRDRARRRRPGHRRGPVRVAVQPQRKPAAGVLGDLARCDSPLAVRCPALRRRTPIRARAMNTC